MEQFGEARLLGDHPPPGPPLRRRSFAFSSSASSRFHRGHPAERRHHARRDQGAPLGPGFEAGGAGEAPRAGGGRSGADRDGLRRARHLALDLLPLSPPAGSRGTGGAARSSAATAPARLSNEQEAILLELVRADPGSRSEAARTGARRADRTADQARAGRRLAHPSEAPRTRPLAGRRPACRRFHPGPRGWHALGSRKRRLSRRRRGAPRARDHGSSAAERTRSTGGSTTASVRRGGERRRGARSDG